MNITKLFLNTISSVALPILAFSEDPAEPGKASDAVRNPPASNPAGRDLTPAPADPEPGKTSDAVREPSSTSNERQFNGRITSVNRSDNTITVNDQTVGSQLLHIGETTKMKRGTAGASWDDLKVGENVQGMMRTDGARAHASSIEIGK